ncbi:hypothetical protein [Flavisolibacter ginsenosidimutans]|uniref:Uncharacterized protein n=1 Tax=Flavisolibacter ginsenosidimutans TaxID=661481 RepID=A0A5B8UE61_9BACT|nr:hypothetical protein [Flavisolibacter ginsenosidimutans]QEC54635.1 hypothetical protein FSB75_01540 [Flavisolibacter ginsenosidimutans]
MKILQLPFGSFHFLKNGTVFRGHFTMEPRNQKENSSSQQGHHEYPLKQEISPAQQKLNEAAHTEAEKDIEDDVELSAHSPNDDLDEGESARLGEDVPI